MTATARNTFGGVTPIEPTQLAPEGSTTRLWFLLVPTSRSYASLLEPTAWSKTAPKLNLHDVVRCRAADRSFDVLLTVGMKTGTGVVMEYLAGRKPEGVQ